jgi:hypothetical protein
MARKPIGKQIRVQVLARDGYKCKMCGRTKAEVSLEVDHIIPVADGGTDELKNLATLCRDCNRGKTAYRFTDYTRINILPHEIMEHIKFIRDDKFGDYYQYHLYIYYKDGINSGPLNRKFHHTWRISGSVFDSSSNSAALENRRRDEEAAVFLGKVRDKLIDEGKKLVFTEEGLCKI